MSRWSLSTVPEAVRKLQIVFFLRRLLTVGRAPAPQSGGRRFKSRSRKFFFVHPEIMKTILTVEKNKMKIIPCKT